MWQKQEEEDLRIVSYIFPVNTQCNLCIQLVLRYQKTNFSDIQRHESNRVVCREDVHAHSSIVVNVDD